MSEFKAVFNKITEKRNGTTVCVVKVYPRGEPKKEEIEAKTCEVVRKLNSFESMLNCLKKLAGDQYDSGAQKEINQVIAMAEGRT